jgi:hypothetical protein
MHVVRVREDAYVRVYVEGRMRIKFMLGDLASDAVSLWAQCPVVFPGDTYSTIHKAISDWLVPDQSVIFEFEDGEIEVTMGPVEGEEITLYVRLPEEWDIVTDEEYNA